MIISKSILRQYAYNAGFRGTHLDAAIAIAECESGYNTNAHCLNCYGVAEDSRGLWQINVNAHPQYKNVDLFDPQTNANAAFQVYLESGSDFSPWTCAHKLGLVNPPQKKSNYLFAFVIFIALYLHQ